MWEGQGPFHLGLPGRLLDSCSVLTVVQPRGGESQPCGLPCQAHRPKLQVPLLAQEAPWQALWSLTHGQGWVASMPGNSLGPAGDPCASGAHMASFTPNYP